jgi:hypothetical protein
MADRPPLLDGPLKVANVGVDLFAEELRRQGVEVREVRWRPPAPGADQALERLAFRANRIATANDIAVSRLQEAQPLLLDVDVAGRALPGMDRKTFLHAGPPIEWADMSGPLHGAVIGAAIYEGLASNPEEAGRMAEAGAFEFAPCHDRGAVGPMAGVISFSMPVWVVENVAGGNRAHATLNEGLGKVLRYGAYDKTVQTRLRWIQDTLARVMADVVRHLPEPIDLRATIAHALQMGDEGHNRNRAGNSLLLRALLPGLLESSEPSADLASSARFIDENDHFFLNLVMAAAKASADSAAGVERASIVTAMARNGTEFGIRLSGTHDEWFTGPASEVEGLFFPGFDASDANPDIGDSTITETVGLGGFAMAASPAITQFVGTSPTDALNATRRMYAITWSESQNYLLPALGFRGSPLGIDCREVVHTGELPVINTGIAHREPGVGQVGAGIVAPPMDPFVAATRRLAEVLEP